MFGAGTAAAFAAHVDLTARFPGVTATTFEWSGADYVGTETKWATSKGVLVGVWRLNWQSTVVHCPGLVIEPAFRGKGGLTQLCEGLNHWWPTLGLTQHTLTTDPESNAGRMLRLAGFEKLEKGLWGCPLPSTKLDEAVAYLKAKKEGLNPEQPAWRTGIPAPAEEAF